MNWSKTNIAEVNNQKQRIFLEIFGMTLLYIMLDTAGIYKYIAVIVVGTIILALNFKKIEIVFTDCYITIPVLVHCGLGMLLSVFGGIMTSWTLKTLVFWLLPLTFALILSMIYKEDRNRMIDVQFWGCVLAYFVPKSVYIVSAGGFESTFAFVFGLFAVYYVYRRKWSWMVTAVLLMYFANKRIAMLAAILCFALMAFMKIVKYGKQWIAALWGMLMAVCGAYVYSIHSGIFIELCEKFGIQTSHRIEVYPKIAEQIPEQYFLGQGLGTTNEMLGEVLDPWLYSWFENPHNDFLKIFVDLGAIGLILFLASYLVVFYLAWKKGVRKSALSQLFVTFVYFMMLMTTDNVSIYILFLVPMHSICLALVEEKG